MLDQTAHIGIACGMPGSLVHVPTTLQCMPHRAARFPGLLLQHLQELVCAHLALVQERLPQALGEYGDGERAVAIAALMQLLASPSHLFCSRFLYSLLSLAVFAYPQAQIVLTQYVMCLCCLFLQIGTAEVSEWVRWPRSWPANQQLAIAMLRLAELYSSSTGALCAAHH